MIMGRLRRATQAQPATGRRQTAVVDRGARVHGGGSAILSNLAPDIQRLLRSAVISTRYRMEPKTILDKAVAAEGDRLCRPGRR